MSEKVKKLPIQGAKLIQMTFRGNGKDSEVSIETEGSAPLELSLSSARMCISSTAELLTETFGPGDTSVEIRLKPLRKGSVVLQRAVVFFPGTDQEWKETLKGWRSQPQRWDSSWCVNKLELRLADSNDRAAPRSPKATSSRSATKRTKTPTPRRGGAEEVQPTSGSEPKRQ